MSFTTDPPLFLPFDNDQNIPRSRLSASSIWAPQPQPSETTWPKAIDSFSRVLAERQEHHPEVYRKTSVPITREDVFGPIGFQDDARKRDIGAIGEGRKKNSPDFDDTVRIFRPTARSIAANAFVFSQARRTASSRSESRLSRSLRSTASAHC
jgi:pumilio RNA-binding family